MTAPENLMVACRAFDTKEYATAIGEAVASHVGVLSRLYDLSRLDGVTVAFDYAQALRELDVGYQSSHELSPSDGDVVGVAMTPTVLRANELKSHIVLNAPYVLALAKLDDNEYQGALHIVAHECAHVETSHRFDAAFPNVLRRKSVANARIAYRWDTILGCWDEYSATRLSAGIGRDPTEDYEDTFLKALVETRGRANRLIAAYRTHADLSQILAEVYGAYGKLMKYAAYHLGNLAGAGIEITSRSRTVEALRNHWFAQYFDRLREACERIARDYGKWTEMSSFEAIGDLIDEIVAEGGVLITEKPDGSLHVRIPFTPETMA